MIQKKWPLNLDTLIVYVHVLKRSILSDQSHLKDSLITALKYGTWVTSAAEGFRPAGNNVETSLWSLSWLSGFMDSRCKVHARVLAVLTAKKYHEVNKQPGLKIHKIPFSLHESLH